MRNVTLTEQDKASLSGPRDMKEPGELDWCWQTISALQSMWKSLDLDFERYQRVWHEAEEHRVWEKIPPGDPYGTKESMLERLQVGDKEAARVRVAAEAAMVRPARKPGRPQNGDNPYHDKGFGTSADYLTRRIARDRPDIWERMKKGEFTSVAAAAREAGIARNTRKSVALGDPAKVAKALRQHYTPEERRRIAEELLRGN